MRGVTLDRTEKIAPFPALGNSNLRPPTLFRLDTDGRVPFVDSRMSQVELSDMPKTLAANPLWQNR